MFITLKYLRAHEKTDFNPCVHEKKELIDGHTNSQIGTQQSNSLSELLPTVKRNPKNTNYYNFIFRNWLHQSLSENAVLPFMTTSSK